MADYISREEAIESVEEWYELYPDSDTAKEALSLVKRDIKKLNATDRTFAPKGRWIKDSDGLDVCSECKAVALQRVFIKLPEKIVDLQMVRSCYCPNCGADMREVEP